MTNSVCKSVVPQLNEPLIHMIHKKIHRAKLQHLLELKDVKA